LKVQRLLWRKAIFYRKYAWSSGYDKTKNCDIGKHIILLAYIAVLYVVA